MEIENDYGRSWMQMSDRARKKRLDWNRFWLKM